MEGCNALDFVLPLELGHILPKDPAGCFHIDKTIKTLVKSGFLGFTENDQIHYKAARNHHLVLVLVFPFTILLPTLSFPFSAFHLFLHPLPDPARSR